MPSKSTVFTPSSILFRPRRNPWSFRGLAPWAWVEAPGTAPGSDRFIAQAIYRHSRKTGIPNIGLIGLRLKSNLAEAVRCGTGVARGLRCGRNM